MINTAIYTNIIRKQQLTTNVQHTETYNSNRQLRRAIRLANETVQETLRRNAWTSCDVREAE